ncbi:hypothetical protein [Roseospira goensis]|uniref:Uncharacterized protein YceK n=1 Tax=Roseospira goensis TaxID=391922 RepID=A0A7W6WK26_9PROT|nr:hypothetical protein [Roseospira goensis]MBB4285916.1 uncharacterized protein YceK [Roseospira goensis]
MPNRFISVASVATLSAALALAGCASSSENIAAAYVSPNQYANYSCDQIREEQGRVGTRVRQLAGDVDDNATGDAVAMGVGMILFWPALFFIEGDGPEANEYARLKGEHEALQKAAIEHNCTIPTRTPPAAMPEAETADTDPDTGAR